MLLKSAIIHRKDLAVTPGDGLYRPEEKAGPWLLVEEPEGESSTFWLQPAGWAEDPYLHDSGIYMGTSLAEAEEYIASKWTEA